MFHHAIVRPPSPNFADGLTTVDLGKPDYALALRQHNAYCEALQKCGLALTCLETDARYPDSTFVEDTAILVPQGAITTRPGAASRQGEVMHMREVLSKLYPALASIEAPGTLDGGDICEAGQHFFVGLSERTNEAGAKQLASWLALFGYTTTCIDIRGMTNILHLKSGLAYLGNHRLVVIDSLVERASFEGFEQVRVPQAEDYAANCLSINDTVLIAAGYPKFEATLRGLGYATWTLDMSEYRKMDGGLSCLSLRF